MMYSTKAITRRARSLSAPLALFLLATPAALAQLERAGPNSTANGYPLWFQDKTGLALEFCTPNTAAELQGAWCVLGPGDTTAPENIDNAANGQFADEHFYFLATAQGLTTFGGKAKLVLALEGAFGGGPVLAGDQIVFARVRAFITGLPNGDYKVYHPYGTIGPIHVDSGRLFVTDDIGLACPPGQFDCALAGKIGPWLLPAATPGGGEIPAVQGPVSGTLYIADPARLGPITGSPIGQNYFRVVSLAGSVETDILAAPPSSGGQITDFSLAGRLFTGVIPGRAKVDRAVYSNDGTNRRVDVFASVFPTVQGRLPGAAKPVEVTPQLGYYHGACNADPTTGALSAPTGQNSAPMRTTGHVSWGQTTPLSADPIPLQVCVEDKTSSTFYEANVTDDVRISQALYNPNNGSLTVNAASSDVDPTVQLSLVYPGGTAQMPGGAVAVNVTTPPNRIQVVSSKRGTSQNRITTTLLTSPILLTDILTAQNLIVTAQVGTPVTITIPNAGVSGNTINIVTQATSGSAAPVFDTAGSTDAIVYTPSGAAGVTTDFFTYVLTSNCNAQTSCSSITSNVATVTVNIVGAVPPPPPPPPAGEAITVTSAAYRADQKRWTVSGTDNLQAGQVLTIKNIGTATVVKDITVGTALVTAGAWSLDVRGVAAAATAGDRLVAVNANVTPNVVSPPVTISVR